jgi:ribosomal protein L11 methyltransferase
MNQYAIKENDPIFSIAIKNSNIIEYFQEGKIDFKLFGIIGIEEFSLNEAEVDLILGNDAYCGGDPGDDLIEKIENYYSQNTKLKIFFINYESSFNFIKWFNQQIVDASLLDDNNEYLLEKVEDIDWVENWKVNYKPLVIGNELLILPDFLSENAMVLDTNLKNLIIKPGRGFGTGTHETTQLCLENFLNVKNLIPEDSLILDYGCGSGILGIGAKLFKPSAKLELFDIDPNALENAKDNLLLNSETLNKTEIIYFEEKEKLVESEKKFLIFANILLPILKAEREFLINNLDNQFILIMSGVLENQVEELIEYYQNGFSQKNIEVKVMTYQKNEWCSVVFSKILN